MLSFCPFFFFSLQFLRQDLNVNSVCSPGWPQPHNPSSSVSSVPGSQSASHFQFRCFCVMTVGPCPCFPHCPRLAGIEHKIPPFLVSRVQEHIWCRRGRLISTQTFPSIHSSVANGHQAHGWLREASSALEPPRPTSGRFLCSPGPVSPSWDWDDPVESHLQPVPPTEKTERRAGGLGAAQRMENRLRPHDLEEFMIAEPGMGL